MPSNSVRGVLEGVDESPENVIADKEKLSSDQQMLSRRKASPAMRFPVWRRTIASSIRPR